MVNITKKLFSFDILNKSCYRFLLTSILFRKVNNFILKFINKEYK